MSATASRDSKLAGASSPAEPRDAVRSPGRVDQRALLRQGVTAILLVLAGTGVVLAVPDLRPVTSEISQMNPALVIAAAALELASCVSFVVIFRLFFAAVEPVTARELAWVEMGSGALLPGGGAGSLAVGGWLLHLAGMSTRQIVHRSSGLFFLTSAINVVALGAAGAALLLGIGHGPHDALRAGLPVVLAIGAIALVLAIGARSQRFSPGHRRAAWIKEICAGIPAARQALLRPHWRLSGAIGYLLFDIAVLWVALAAVGGPPPVAALVIAYLVGYLANAIPVPGGIGVLDAGLVGALTLYGLPLTHATAAVLVYHAIAFWIPTLGGTIAYPPLRHRLRASND